MGARKVEGIVASRVEAAPLRREKPVSCQGKSHRRLRPRSGSGKVAVALAVGEERRRRPWVKGLAVAVGEGAPPSVELGSG